MFSRAERLTNHDVVSDDCDPIVSIWSGMLVPKTDSVAQFVNNDAKFVTVLANRDCLGAISTFSNKGATPW
jgi:hypothetical protein